MTESEREFHQTMTQRVIGVQIWNAMVQTNTTREQLVEALDKSWEMTVQRLELVLFGMEDIDLRLFSDIFTAMGLQIFLQNLPLPKAPKEVKEPSAKPDADA